MVDTSLGFTTPDGTDDVLPTSQMALTAGDIDSWLTTQPNLGAQALARYTGTYVTGAVVTFPATQSLRLVLSGSLSVTVKRFVQWRINQNSTSLYRSMTALKVMPGETDLVYGGLNSDLSLGRVGTFGSTFFTICLDFNIRGGLPVWTGTVVGESTADWTVGTTGGILRTAEIPARFDISVDSGQFDNLRVDVTGFPQ